MHRQASGIRFQEPGLLVLYFLAPGP
jgi:hypothetical protein